MERLIYLLNVTVALVLLVAGCGGPAPQVVEVEKEVPVKESDIPMEEAPAAAEVTGKTVKFLTQNAMFLPSGLELLGKCKAVEARTPCVIELVKPYHIVGLQEVFAEDSQNAILAAWRSLIKENEKDPKAVIVDFNGDHYTKKWPEIDDTEDVDDLVGEVQPYGVEVVDIRPNKEEAELVCGPYYVMGPDRGGVNIDQDGGLMILSRFPIIRASAFCFEECKGDDCLANKGALYARIQVGSKADQYIHVFNTHLDAGTKDEAARTNQLEDLRHFIKKATENDGRPVVLLGDLNVTGSLSPGQRSSLLSEYKTMRVRFEGSTPALADMWLELHPDSLDAPWQSWCTWYGKDNGNPLAVEDGAPDRVDYFFYHTGTEVRLTPTSIKVVPDLRDPKTRYCFDKRTGETCNKISEGDSCPLKSYTVSDHLGVEMECEVGYPAAPTPPQPEPIPTATSAVTPTPEPPGEAVPLRLHLPDEPWTLDPALALDRSEIFIVEHLFLGLTDFDYEAGQVVPELATSWEVSDGGTEYYFHLRPDVEWTDGTPITAHDVAYSIRRVLDPATGSTRADLLYVIKNAEAVNKLEEATEENLKSIWVEALDDYTVRFTLEEPAGYFPTILSMPVAKPVPQHVIGAYGETWTEPEKIVTNGPYQLSEWSHNERIMLDKNPDWWGADEVAVNRVDLLIVGETEVALEMYRRGDLDFMEVDSSIPDKVMADPALREDVQIGPSKCSYFYGFNVTKPPVDDPLVRQALSYAIDRQALVDVLFEGAGIPAATLAPPGVFGSPAEDPSFPHIAYGASFATRLLDLAGYPGGAGLPRITLMFSTREVHQMVAEFIQANWRDVLGIEVELVIKDWPEYVQTRAEDPPHIFYYGWCHEYPDENNWLVPLFHSTEGYNRIRWSNAEFDSLVEQAAAEIDTERRKELYFRAEEILNVDGAGIIPLYYPTRVYLVKHAARHWYRDWITSHDL